MANARDSRNFGAGRQLTDAACKILATNANAAENVEKRSGKGNGSAATEKTISALHGLREYMEKDGLKCLENVTQEYLENYARSLAGQVQANLMAPSTAAGKVSSLNRVFKLDPEKRGLNVSAEKFDISRIDRISRWDKSTDDKTANAVKDSLADKYRESGDIRYQALSAMIDIQRAAGLRFEEAAKIKLDKKDFKDGKVNLKKGDGTKNGKPREFTPARAGIEALKNVQAYQAEHKHIYYQGSLMPGDQKYESFRWFAYHAISEINGRIGNETAGFHCNRHHYAHESYTEKWHARTGHRVECSLAAGKAGRGEWKAYAAKITNLPRSTCWRIDREIRLAVSVEMGHHRIEVMNSYMGSAM